MTLPYVDRRENPLRSPGRMEPLHWERFDPSQAEQSTFLWWCVCIFAYATIFSVGVDALRLVLVLPFYAFGLDIIRWWVRFSAGRMYVPRLRLLSFPFTLTWVFGIVAPLMAHSQSPILWFGAVVAIMTWRMIRVGQKIRTHYIDYCLEHPGLSYSTREKWKHFRKLGWKRWGNRPSPTNQGSGWSQFYWAVKALRSGRAADWVMLGSAIVATVISMTAFGAVAETSYRTRIQSLVIGVSITGMSSIGILRCLGGGQSLWITLSALWHAVQTWCHSPPTVARGARAAWSERSRFGDAENRRAYLVWNVVLVTLLLLSAVVFYPLFNGDVDSPGELRYPLVGSGLFSRLYMVQADPNMTTPVRGIYIAATLLAPPLFFASGLLALVGPTARACRVLFEEENALEHERTPPGSGVNAT